MSYAKSNLTVSVLMPVLASLLCCGGYGNFLQGSPGTAESPIEEDVLTVIAVGDILLSRHVGRKIDQAKDPTVPFENVKSWLANADIAFGNLESPIVPGNVPLREGVVFRCLTRYIPGLLFAGFDVLSTANNHALDQGEEGVEYTLDYLDSQKILAVGTRKKGDQKSFGRLIEKNGVVVGFLAYSYAAYNDGGTRQNPQVATWHDLKLISEEIRLLKGKADVLFVSIHAGGEYRRQPERAKTEFARAAIDAGADAIIGHHPHWIQSVEIYRDKPIFYSLGNFVFDQGHTLETSEGLMVEFSIRNKQLHRTRLLPVAIERFCCPAMAGAETKRAILKKIGLDSDEILSPGPKLTTGK